MIGSTVDWLHTLRANELDFVIDRYRFAILGKDLLEIGAGTGYQLRELRKYCEYCVGIDVLASAQLISKVDDVLIYDGKNLPFGDASFDVIYTSNVLEHVDDLACLLRECRRVLRAGGYAIHVLPTHWWKVWTALTHWPSLPLRAYARLRRLSTNGRKEELDPSGDDRPTRPGARLANVLFPPRHGERGNRLSEFAYFHPSHWRSEFLTAGWRIEDVCPVGVAYSGNALFQDRVPVGVRRKIARIFGSSCVSYLVT